jgi:predicted nucleic-acid-binding protein
MKVIADTNLLVRLAVNDDPRQKRAAAKAVMDAQAVVVSCHAICEMVWVLGSSYGFSKAEIISTVEKLCEIKNVVLDNSAVEAGLAIMRAGADFADGIIAHEGAWFGGETFVSFDKKAVHALTATGHNAKLLE